MRFAHEKETSENSKNEGARLKEQLEKLVPFQIPGLNFKIEFRGCRSLIDGHTRVLWYDGLSDSTNNCAICG